MRIQDSQLYQFINSAGLVAKKDLLAAEQIARKENRPLSETLLSGGYLSEDDLRRVEAYILGIPFVSLEGKTLDFSVLSLIPEPICRDHNVVAFHRTDKAVEVALLNIADLGAIEFISKKTGLRLLPRLTSTESMRGALMKYQRFLKGAFGDTIAGALKSLPETADYRDLDEGRLKKLAEDPATARLIDALLRHALTEEASDVHIEPPEREILVRYRIDGILRDSLSLPRQAAASLIVRLKSLARLDLTLRSKPQEGRFKMEMDGQKISVRVSTLPVFQGEKITLRLVRENRSGFTLEGIGFHGLSLERVYGALRRKSGLILVAGPFESGRTTTLYTLLDILNTPSVSIATIESPIEYQMPRVSQSEVRNEAGLTYPTGLRAILRQDPDIVMIGDINDRETAELAVRAAESGVLVLASITADSAAAAVERMMALGVDPARLAYAFLLSIGQRLVRQLAEHKETYTLSSREREELAKGANLDLVMMHLKEEGVLNGAATWSAVPFYRPEEGAPEDEVFKGRFALHEIMTNSSAITAAITAGHFATEIEAIARREGMLTLFEDGVYKAARGATSLEEVKKVLATE